MQSDDMEMGATLSTHIRLLKEANATIENYREGVAYAIQLIKHCHDCAVNPGLNDALALLDTLLGMDGKAHLKALRDHETKVMGLLAFRANAIEALLPDVCPHCQLPGHQHAEQCRYGLALTMLPDGMPSIEEGSTFKLGVIGQQIRSWADRLEASAIADSVVDDMRTLASKI